MSRLPLARPLISGKFHSKTQMPTKTKQNKSKQKQNESKQKQNKSKTKAKQKQNKSKTRQSLEGLRRLVSTWKLICGRVHVDHPLSVT
jgi:hypothetical protein